jgi:hypothetical protein
VFFRLGFPNCGTVAFQAGVILCCGGMSCALESFSSNSGLCTLDVSNKSSLTQAVSTMSPGIAKCPIEGKITPVALGFTLIKFLFSKVE